MNVQTISPRGYCLGVINAIKLALKIRKEYPNDKIYLLGMIVHNSFIKDALTLKNIETLDPKKYSKYELIDQIDSGIIILSAHGTSKKIKKILDEKKLTYFDATCKDVTKTELIMEDYIKEGYDVIYVGKKDHPEAIAAIDIDENKVHLVCEVEDLDNLEINNSKIILTNQTTLSIKELKSIFEKAKNKFATLEFVEEICDATRTRQEAIELIDDDVDIVFVVGDPQSNNSNKLAGLAKKENRNVYLIESINDIKVEWLENKKKAAISSGASTPTYLTNMVIEYLKNFDFSNIKTHEKPMIDYNKILD